MPDTSDLLAVVPGFCAEFRRLSGRQASPAHAITFQRAIEAIPRLDLEDLYWAGQATIGVGPHERVAYDTAFASYFLGIEAPSAETGEPEASPTEQGSTGDDADPVQVPTPRSSDTEGSGEEDAEDVGGEASTAETLRLTPFATCTEREQATIQAMVRRLAADPPRKLTRRTMPSPTRGGSMLDLRRTVRRAFRYGGPIQARWRVQQRRPRRLVVLIDVSRSMGPYSRLFLHFAHALLGTNPRMEVVCFGTRVTRVTRLLRRHRSELGLERAAATVLDWDGGTRIGEAVRIVQSMGVVRGALRDSVVLIMSDGLEQDDPDTLGDVLQRLRRTCHSVVWANPLAGDPRYRPLTAGMIAALPSIDALVACDTVASLEAVLGTVSRFQASASNPGRHGLLHRRRTTAAAARA